jgi:cell division protein FtsN
MPEKQNSVTLTPNNTNLQSEEAIKKIVTASAPVPTKIEPAKAAVPVQQKPVTPPQVQAVKNGNAYLQIGAYRSEADALVGFTKAKSKFSQLSSAGHNIVKADLGTKGVYYRLRVGPFASKEQSLNVCSQLQAKGQACLYIPQ